MWQNVTEDSPYSFRLYQMMKRKVPPDFQFAAFCMVFKSLLWSR